MIMNDKTGTVIGDLGQFGRVMEYKIDTEDTGMVMDIIANRTYTMKELAVVREYICNAWDAHVESGKTAMPFIVTCPTAVEPIFKVRDFGEGLSVEDIEKIYVRIAKSTKRQSNSAIGSYGIGAKSAFAYSDSFTVVSWNNGVCSRYIAQINGQKQARMIHLSSKPSEEMSGIEIQVTVRPADTAKFKSHIINVCQMFPTRPKFVNMLDSDVPVVKKISEGSCWYITGDKYEYNHSYYHNNQVKAVCGNVAYDLDLKKIQGVNFDHVPHLMNIHLVFEIGEVDIPPSRESLEYTPRTIQAVLRVTRKFAEELRANVEKSIKNAKDIVEASVQYPHVFKGMKVQWNGIDLNKITESAYWGYLRNITGVACFARKNDKEFRAAPRGYRFSFNISSGDAAIVVKDESKRFYNRLTKLDKDIKYVWVIDKTDPTAAYNDPAGNPIDVEEYSLMKYWPKGRVIKISSITPDPIVRGQSIGGQRGKLEDFYGVEIREVRNRYSWRGETTRVAKLNPLTKIPDANEKIVWVPIYRGAVWSEKTSFNAMISKVFAPPASIVGVRVAGVKKVPKNWVSFDTWVSEEVNGMLGKFSDEEIALAGEFANGVAITFGLLCDCKELADIVALQSKGEAALKKYNERRTFIEAIHNSGRFQKEPWFDKLLKFSGKVKETPFADAVKVVYAKFPMLKYVTNGRMNLDKADFSAIIEYIKERKGC
jgi:hypothetical protein